MATLSVSERKRIIGNPPADGEEGGLAAFLDAKAAAYRDRIALSLYENGQWRELTYAGLSSASRRVGFALAARGISHGTRVAILSESRPEWGVAFFGSMLAGATVVLLDPKLMAGELEPILADCRPAALFASRRSLETAQALKASAAFPVELYLLDGDEEVSGVRSLQGLKAPSPIPNRGFPRWSARDTAVIVYTSGTSGNPKGVMTGVSNLLFQVRNVVKAVKVDSHSVFLSILPLNHLLELTCGFLGVLHAGATVVYCQSPYPADMLACMREKKVTDMISVPLFLKILKDSILRQAKVQGKEKTLMRALAIAPHLPVFLRRGLFSRVHASLGGRLRAFVSGGSALDPAVEDFFDALGIAVYQGYGLTETSPVISANTCSARKRGTVGRPLPGVEVKLRRPSGAAGAGIPEGTGEILTRGPHVMQGYYNRPDLTREAIDLEGWLATGDLGSLDGDGYLRITGRSKNLIVLPGGKKVQPEEIEEALAPMAEIGEACIFGRICREGPNAGNEEIVAVAVPSQELRERFPEPASSGQALPDTGLEEALIKAVEAGTAGLTAYKRPSRVLVTLDALPKTPSRKIKRAEVARLFEGK